MFPGRIVLYLVDPAFLSWNMYFNWIIYSNSLKIVKNAEQFKLVENQMNNKYMYVSKIKLNKVYRGYFMSNDKAICHLNLRGTS